MIDFDKISSNQMSVKPKINQWLISYLADRGWNNEPSHNIFGIIKFYFPNKSISASI